MLDRTVSTLALSLSLHSDNNNNNNSLSWQFNKKKKKQQKRRRGEQQQQQEPQQLKPINKRSVVDVGAGVSFGVTFKAHTHNALGSNTQSRGWGRGREGGE